MKFIISVNETCKWCKKFFAKLVISMDVCRWNGMVIDFVRDKCKHGYTKCCFSFFSVDKTNIVFTLKVKMKMCN